MERDRSGPSRLMSYPAAAVEAALARVEDARSLASDEAQRRYESLPHLRTSPMLSYLHVVVVGCDAKFEKDEWRRGPDGEAWWACDEWPLEEWDDHPPWEDPFRIIDVDVEDAAGAIYEVRIIFNGGSADANTGYFGQAFDRRDTTRVLADIRSVGDCETAWHTREPAIGFVDHTGPLASLPQMFKEQLCPGVADCQFTALLGLALYAVTRPRKHFPCLSRASSQPLMRSMLRGLSNPNSVANEESKAVQVLCVDGVAHEQIATLAAGRYPMLRDGDETSFDWLLAHITPLLRAVRLSRAGDEEAAMEAYEEVDFDDYLFEMRGKSTNDLYEIFSDESTQAEQLATASTLTLGLSDSDAFWRDVCLRSPRYRRQIEPQLLMGGVAINSEDES